MSPSPRPRDSRRATPAEFLSFLLAYLELVVARWRAVELQSPVRTKPVPYSRFRELQISDEIVLWMIYQAHVQHFVAAHMNADDHAGLRPALTLHMGKTSYFGLTDLGVEFACSFLADVLLAEEDTDFERARSRLLLGTLTPSYDRENRVFAWGRHVLKWFRQPAVNQMLVLSAAEEQLWSPWFDDPLPPRPGTKSKVLLHNTINDLNRRQAVQIIHFRGDGTGTRIGWEYR